MERLLIADFATADPDPLNSVPVARSVSDESDCKQLWLRMSFGNVLLIQYVTVESSGVVLYL